MKMFSPLTLLAVSSLPVMLAVLVCIQYVDSNVAKRVWQFTSSHPFIHNRIKDISSPLPALAVIATFALWLTYCVMSRTIRDGKQLQFIKLAKTTIPAAFLIKTLLQYVFGRTNTRVWLETGGPITFNWFNPSAGSSFPSGHTILVTAFLAAVWRYYPPYDLWLPYCSLRLQRHCCFRVIILSVI